jgi:predicted  nucleic acid-binding Zn-ribbon protein
MNHKAKALIDLQSLEFRMKQQRRQVVSKHTAAIARLRSEVGPQLLHQYETRKRRYGATSVVPIRGELCSGCRISLCLGTRRRAYTVVTECEHCARLLYNPAKRRRLRIEIV